MNGKIMEIEIEERWNKKKTSETSWFLELNQNGIISCLPINDKADSEWSAIHWMATRMEWNK